MLASELDLEVTFHKAHIVNKSWSAHEVSCDIWFCMPTGFAFGKEKESAVAGMSLISWPTSQQHSRYNTT